jgi:undecaprenyl-diphosphatase
MTEQFSKPLPARTKATRVAIVGGVALGAAIIALTLAGGSGPLTAPKAIVLGVVEGITEYLPVSSTGHLLVTQRLLDLGTGTGKTAADTFAIAIQLGAILAVVALYRARIGQLAAGLVGRSTEGRQLLVRLVVAFLPAAVIGAALDHPIKDHLFGPWPVVAAWVAGGVFLLVWKPGHGTAMIDAITIRGAAIIGLAQTLALWPGVSRSLVTIVAALALGCSMIAAWNVLYLRQSAFRPEPSRSAEWNRGAYLVQSLGHCGSCHSPRNSLGAEKADAELAGGEAQGWYAPALNDASPSPLPWTVEHLSDYLRTGTLRVAACRRAVVLGAAFAVVLAACSSGDASSTTPTTAGDVGATMPAVTTTTTTVATTTTATPTTAATTTTAGGPPPLPGMPPVVDPHDVYSETASGDLSPAVAEAKAYVYVPSNDDGSVTVIDQATLAVVDHYRVGRLVQHVVPAWDLKTLYANASGSNQLVPIDPATGKRGAAIRVDAPYNLYFRRTERRPW